ncbi:MAG: hypothetical protein RIT02_1360 [Planctomycetota bacterium]|jgi:hypothetical protein
MVFSGLSARYMLGVSVCEGVEGVPGVSVSAD